MGQQLPSSVIVVADLIDGSEDEQVLAERRDLERTDLETLAALSDAITSLGVRVIHVEGPDGLAQLGRSQAGAVVLTIYGGRVSRNRMALVPAICESLGLRFIGPDVYGRVVAQDKAIAKRLARDAGLLTPRWRLVRDRASLKAPIGLQAPMVIKPVLEGSSIGITARNLVQSEDEAVALVDELLTTFEQPVLVEEFVEGREVAFARIENAGSEAWALSEMAVRDEPDFFLRRLFDAEEKFHRRPGRFVRNIDGELTECDREALERLLRFYGTYGYCRIDGRLSSGRFHFIELTPDAWIAPLGQFAMGFTTKGWSYEQVICSVLSSAAPSPPNR